MQHGKALYDRKLWVVVQDKGRAEDVRWPQLLAVRISSNIANPRPSHVILEPGSGFQGAVLAETLTGVPRWRFVAHAGAISAGTMRRIEVALMRILGMEP